MQAPLIRSESYSNLRSRPESPSLSDAASDHTFEIEEPSHGHKGNTVAEAIYHIICVIAGSGVLQLPYALNQSGWIGVGLIVFSAFSNQYAGGLLIKCLYANSRGSSGRRLTGFSAVGYEAYGKPGKILVELFTDAMLLGVPIVYFILTGMNLEFLFGTFSMKVWMVLSAFLIMIPFLMYKTLKEIAIFSAFGVFATLVVIGTVIVSSIHDMPINYDKVTHKFIDFRQFASALGSISFSYSGNFIYPEVEASMAEPKKFRMVLSLSMVIISAIRVRKSHRFPILNNLPPGIIANSAVFLITAHILFAIPVLVTSFSLEVERRLDLAALSNSNIVVETKYRWALRSVIMVVIVGLAMAVPFFKDFMTLLGALANTALIFVFPVLFDFKLFGFHNRTWNEKVFGIVIMIVGVFGGVVGGFEAVVALANDISGAKGPSKPGGH
ncbi:hypothetical protein BCR33DRAFT_783519 [Rhizoclosmatium globosum]|uniref:Amino acid transporter transmembrane domain-containing protein n=1 Tax=Rhizoclosmatium globosum TaxID=329046 RepID=A0A1Y2CH57_9FUNG|nr:hypothetical protein BCR33DRAFT_783519 [Rhizoclosmatium globosum]|eukprot:ORY46342.1 hypothetical protein BCR33DRAFT_783519 [Rhizoclosmatium globosum]